MLIKGEEVGTHLVLTLIITLIEIELILSWTLLDWSRWEIKSCILNDLFLRCTHLFLRCLTFLYWFICLIITSNMLFTLLFFLGITFYIFCHFSVVISWKSHSTTAAWSFKIWCSFIHLLPRWSHLRPWTWLSKRSILCFNLSCSWCQIYFR